MSIYGVVYNNTKGCNCNWRICSAPPTISPMAHYTVKLSCLKRSINDRKQIGLEMSLKSRRGSYNLKFGGQTIPDAGGSNSKRPVADLSPSAPNDQVAAAWWSQWWPRRIACRRCQQFGNVIRYLANKRLVYQKAKFVVNTRSNRRPMLLAKGRSHVITWSQADHNPCCRTEDSLQRRECRGWKSG